MEALFNVSEDAQSYDNIEFTVPPLVVRVGGAVVGSVGPASIELILSQGSVPGDTRNKLIVSEILARFMMSSNQRSTTINI